MGCGQSKIENEEAVTRCKDRKLHMKDAVSFRNAFAAAHSAYAMSLKNSGAALSDFAHGEVMNPNILPTTTPIHPSLPATSASVTAAQPPPPPHPDILPPPPPPNASPSPLHRAVSMPEMKIPIKKENLGSVGPTIMEEDDDDDDEMEIENRDKLVMRKRGSSRREEKNDPSPPPPPQPQPVVMTSASPPSPVAMQGGHDSRWTEISDYIFQPQESMMGPGLTPVEEVKDEKVFDERPKRVEAKVAVEAVAAPEKAVVVDTPVVVVGGGSGGSVGKNSKKGKGGVERRVVKGSVNLLQIFLQLDDHFLKASESAHEVSKMLEAARLHYHSNFADNRGNDLRLSDYIGEFRYVNWNNDSVCLNL